MILVATNRFGAVFEVLKDEDMFVLDSALEDITELLEDMGIMCIKKEVSINLCRNYEFASEENGWEVGIGTADGWVTSLSHDDEID